MGLGSDHGLHVNIIQRIKKNRHRFISDYLLCYNENNPCYPQLFHWILSFLPLSIIERKAKRVSLALSILETVLFNFFIILFQVRSQVELSVLQLILANLVFFSFPFSYAVWNAKNTGISARQAGIIGGQIFLYAIAFYIDQPNLYLLVGLYLIGFIIVLLSQFAMQYLLFSILFFSLAFDLWQLIGIPIVAYILFYAIMPKVAVSYIKGQFNHKRNYALYMAEIFILKSRPSIYLDFIRDFWLQLRENKIKGLYYIYGNPLVELLYGFTYFWPLVYLYIFGNLEAPWNRLVEVAGIGVGIFIVTSFRKTRFLGEPQRYMEFAIPLIAISFISVFDPIEVFLLLLLNLIIILIPRKLILRGRKLQRDQDAKHALMISMKDKDLLGDELVWSSNDSELLKELAVEGVKICRPDYTSYFSSKSEFKRQFFDDFLGNISPSALKDYLNKYPLKGIVLNTDIYGMEGLPLAVKQNWEYSYRIDNYQILHN
ncbi:hypothetical protein BFP97_13640 [Roseivirga sp. 4D4]|nr:hypothetical protein BFP97_13640 [Roseivirga sp. 4D4]